MVGFGWGWVGGEIWRVCHDNVSMEGWVLLRGWKQEEGLCYVTSYLGGRGVHTRVSQRGVEGVR
jgi:hypothetical protein